MQSPPTKAARDTVRAQSSDKFHLWLDEPADWNLKVRRLRLSGWCVAKKGPPLVGIRARVAGEVFAGRFDRERPEVGPFIGVQDAPRWCGFTVDAEVPVGRRRLELQVRAEGGEWQKAFARNVSGPLRVGAAELRLWEGIDDADARWRYVIHFSRPRDWNKPVRQLHLAGWCVDRTGGWTHGLRVQIDGKTTSVNFGIARPDVAALFPDVASAGRSGFAGAVTLPRGRHKLALQLLRDDGSWRQIFSHDVIGGDEEETVTPGEETFFAAQPAQPRFLFWFDRPADWSQRVRHLHISGWCFAAWGDEILELRARSGREMFRANYGIVRPDVAATFDAHPAALRSGFSVDVTLPWRPSTLVFEARGRTGRWEEFFTHRARGSLWRAARTSEHESIGDYAEWIRLYDRLGRDDLRQIESEIEKFVTRPRISVLLPVYDPEARWLRRAIDSVRAQVYPDWELCIVDDASTLPHVAKILQRYARADARIKVLRRATNGHISAASNDTLALATGEFIALLDHDDELARTALYHVAHAINQHPDLGLLYSDEDKLDRQGRRCDPYFKPDWDPDLLTSQNYISHLSVYRADLVRGLGGFRTGFEGSQDYDLTLRAVERLEPRQIRHVPHVLYHWRIAEQSTATFAAAKPYAHQAAIRAVQEYVDRRGLRARAVPHYADYLRVIYAPPQDQPRVSIIIPTRDRVSLLRQSVASVRAKTEYPNIELIIVDNDSRDPATLDYLAQLEATGEAIVLRAAGEFNFSRLNNLGVARATGLFVALLNNDVEAKNRDWLTEMISHAARPEVGAVGARLWYPDGTLQHGGVILGVGGVATHAHNGLRKEHGYFARAHLTQNFSAVTAACLVLRRDVYRQLGGFDETNLAVAFNDVDFCLRLRAGGLLVTWTPHAELVHHESVSRGLEDTGWKQRRFLAEVAFMREKWGAILSEDPFYNPNLSLESNKQFELAFPPRAPKPWKIRD